MSVLMWVGHWWGSAQISASGARVGRRGEGFDNKDKASLSFNPFFVLI